MTLLEKAFVDDEVYGSIAIQNIFESVGINIENLKEIHHILELANTRKEPIYNQRTNKRYNGYFGRDIKASLEKYSSSDLEKIAKKRRNMPQFERKRPDGIEMIVEQVFLDAKVGLTKHDVIDKLEGPYREWFEGAPHRWKCFCDAMGYIEKVGRTGNKHFFGHISKNVKVPRRRSASKPNPRTKVSKSKPRFTLSSFEPVIAKACQEHNEQFFLTCDIFPRLSKEVQEYCGRGSGNTARVLDSAKSTVRRIERVGGQDIKWEWLGWSGSSEEVEVLKEPVQPESLKEVLEKSIREEMLSLPLEERIKIYQSL